ncbi:MAG TPA: protein tyrosine phosphatase family protein [Anaerolineaceae bacterium]|nr:protein tyrosine phosphatase family protein [Anaerolineaceae bacterium]
MHIQDITNFLEVKPWLGTAGMPNSDQLEIIAAAGYQSVINLALDQSPGAIPDEKKLATLLGMKFFHIPVIWEQPKVSQFSTFSSIMKKIEGEKIFVHCVLNMRVSVFVYLYRVLQLGESSQEAYKDILKIWKPDHTWQAFMKEVRSYYE